MSGGTIREREIKKQIQRKTSVWRVTMKDPSVGPLLDRILWENGGFDSCRSTRWVACCGIALKSHYRVSPIVSLLPRVVKQAETA